MLDCPRVENRALGVGGFRLLQCLLGNLLDLRFLARNLLCVFLLVRGALCLACRLICLCNLGKPLSGTRYGHANAMA